MKNELFPFQKAAVRDLRAKAAWAAKAYRETGTPQILSLQAPTGSGKTVIMAALIESILCGSADEPADGPAREERPDAIFVWLSDSPELNRQSREKIEAAADRLPPGRTVEIEESGFDLETLEEGRIYFLNTQKLSRSGNLARKREQRRWTIWETLENTARDKADRLHFVIDEAHRGMQGTEAGRATSIMQRFLKGVHENGAEMRPMPLVVGMSATAERFNRLAEGLPSSVHKTIVTADQVRASGLLKDRIVIGYPEDPSRQDDMAILSAAAGEWMDKCAHWEEYCREQHYRAVNPVFVVQVKAGSKGAVSDTDLDAVVSKIEERTGRRFREGEIVHTFGGTRTLELAGLPVRPIEPSRIAEDRRVQVVLFKENLSTGWDCPRAETMMSFRTANDATYIAQLLGRMVRTPLQNRVKGDETLNEVRLYLPYFDGDTVARVVDELKSSECGDIPTVAAAEAVGWTPAPPWSVHPRREAVYDPRQATFTFRPGGAAEGGEGSVPPPQAVPDPLFPAFASPPARTPPAAKNRQPALPLELDRKAVVDAVNGLGLLTFEVDARPARNPLKSLLDLAGLLTRSGIHKTASEEVEAVVVGKMRDYAEKLRKEGRYEALANGIARFKVMAKTFDAFGNPLRRGAQSVMVLGSEEDLDRQVRAADAKLCHYGFPKKYAIRHAGGDGSGDWKLDAILFAAVQANLDDLAAFAREEFRALDDRFRRRIATRDGACREEYARIAAEGGAERRCFRLAETVENADDPDGETYADHLYAGPDGIARIRLDSWEAGVVAEEERRGDFVCWLRNRQRLRTPLCIPYESGGKTKPMFPDFLVFRREGNALVVDILEPHGSHLADNLAKARGLAKYAQLEPRCGRIQLIRQERTPGGGREFRRLDFNKGLVREKVLRAATPEKLDNLFLSDATVETGRG